MAIVVQKYGGSSMADADKIRTLAKRVMCTRDQGHQVVVIVSAMGVTTDHLLEMARKMSPNPERRELDMLVPLPAVDNAVRVLHKTFLELPFYPVP
jgi:aspartate kinase